MSADLPVHSEGHPATAAPDQADGIARAKARALGPEAKRRLRESRAARSVPVQQPGRLLRRTHGPLSVTFDATCDSCPWRSGLGGEDLHRAAKGHAGREGHRVTVEERARRLTAYEPEEESRG